MREQKTFSKKQSPGADPGILVVWVGSLKFEGHKPKASGQRGLGVLLQKTVTSQTFSKEHVQA